MAKKKKTEGSPPAEEAATPKKHEFTEEELQSPRTPEQFRLALRRKMRIFYDIQELRLATQGRLLKKAPTANIELHPRDLQRLNARMHELSLAEAHAKTDLAEHLYEVPFYKQCIEPYRKDKYKGLGPAMASIIVASFDIHREDTVSKMWAFAGLAPIPAQRCKHCSVVVATDLKDLIGKTAEPRHFRHPKPQGNKCQFAGKDIPATDTFASGKQMRPVAGEKLKYNAWLRTKLCGVLASVLLRLGSPYKRYYDNYKQRWISLNRGVSDAHRHQAAMRYMVKMLLLDIWKEWRAFEGLPVRPSYAEEKLGHVTSMEPVGGTKDVVATPPVSGTFDMNEAVVDSLLEDEARLG